MFHAERSRREADLLGGARRQSPDNLDWALLAISHSYVRQRTDNPRRRVDPIFGYASTFN